MTIRTYVRPSLASILKVPTFAIPQPISAKGQADVTGELVIMNWEAPQLGQLFLSGGDSRSIRSSLQSLETIVLDHQKCMALSFRTLSCCVLVPYWLSELDRAVWVTEP